jgi:phosphatidate cytidylyltransferase
MAIQSNLILRVLTAVLLAPLIGLLIFWENPLGFAGLILAAVGVSLTEFYGMTLPEDPTARRMGLLLGLTLSAAMILGFFTGSGSSRPMLVLTFSTLILFLHFLLRFRDMNTVASRLAFSVLGLLYVPLLLTPLANMKRLPDGGGWVMLTLTICWFADTGAYFAGRFLGKHKLYEAVSPKKTLEGAIGGLVASVGAAFLARAWYLPALSPLDCVLIAVPAGILGQAGDLCESLLKRSCGVKDSGSILPGHGGILDRIDAVLFATPYVYYYALSATGLGLFR